MQYLFAILAVVFMFFFSRNLLRMLFSMENYSIHKKRMKQLRFQKKNEDMEMQELIEKVTNPIIHHVFSRFKPKKLEDLEPMLRLAKWDKYFTPIQYRALNLLLKAIAIVALLLLYNASAIFALIWFVILFFGMGFLFRNSINNRKERLVRDFPDFIRISEGYLTANLPFVQAVSESIKYVGDEWKPILQNFVVECEIKSMEEALDNLKREVDIFETREFVALVKLTLSQGGDAKDSFTAQADKIRQMQMDAIALKINKRRMMATMIQGPLLLCNLAVFGLPTVGSMLNFSSM